MAEDFDDAWYEENGEILDSLTETPDDIDLSTLSASVIRFLLGWWIDAATSLAISPVFDRDLATILLARCEDLRVIAEQVNVDSTPIYVFERLIPPPHQLSLPDADRKALDEAHDGASLAVERIAIRMRARSNPLPAVPGDPSTVPLVDRVRAEVPRQQVIIFEALCRKRTMRLSEVACIQGAFRHPPGKDDAVAKALNRLKESFDSHFEWGCTLDISDAKGQVILKIFSPDNPDKT